MLLLGIDLGSSSVKASVIDGESGKCLATAFSPSDEMKIIALKPGWAEQDTGVWWENLRNAVKSCSAKLGQNASAIGAIGISYQMHGLVTIDSNRNVLRPSIIWCDSRAVYYGFDSGLLPSASPSFSIQGKLLKSVASELGLPDGIPVSYRAGDQPNNALSLNVLNPGEVAATAGTSGVIYGVTDVKKYDDHSRVNTFLHVNHSPANERLGVLLCINGTGILNSWLRRTTGGTLSYNEMNALAAEVAPGSDGLTILP
ncbi:MAG: hypothetical protein HZB98_01330, partial [Bacteroidia bacterium]|nr:hypothetical protein [Bacteroidia bacterium]